MSLLKVQREARKNGLTNVEIGLQFALEGVDFRHIGRRSEIESAMRHDGTQAVPADHVRHPYVVLDEVPSPDLDPEQLLILRETIVDDEYLDG